jgi:hypothetical protein
MKLSTQTIVDLTNALAALDGYVRVIKDGDREQQVRQAYHFNPGLRAAIAKNIARCKAIADAYSKARDNTIYGLTGGLRELDPDDAHQMKEFRRVNDLFLAELHEIDLVTIKESELKLGSDKGLNPIPGTTLAFLAPILEEESWRVPEAPAMVAPPARAANGAAHPAEATADEARQSLDG